MRFKLDENLPLSISKIAADAGHDVETVLSEGLNGYPDNQLINICLREKRTLITLDYDFADVITYPPHIHSGIIILRVKNQSKSAIQALITKILPMFHAHNPEGSLWIVEEERIRIR